MYRVHFERNINTDDGTIIIIITIIICEEGTSPKHLLPLIQNGQHCI